MEGRKGRPMKILEREIPITRIEIERIYMRDYRNRRKRNGGLPLGRILRSCKQGGRHIWTLVENDGFAEHFHCSVCSKNWSRKC